MCGICGIIGAKDEMVRREDIKFMMSALKHRGPDDEGIFINGNVGLGHVRLSIIDLSTAGHQPMFDVSERYCILHNGEVYNYLEIKNELLAKYRFMSQTDTEVILYAYLEWGESCLERFNGMFAFVIYDTKKHEFFIARDRFGIKPMYYLQSKNRFVFASEINSILRVEPKQRIVNDTAVFDYLVYNRTDQSTDTFFKNIKKLDHGHYIIIKNNSVSSHRWYNLPDKLGNEFQSPLDFKNTFVDSIKLRLRSDVPVGVCLSGGLDSSSIVSVLTKVIEKDNLQTFSATYSRDEVDESPYINLYKGSVLKLHMNEPSAETLYSDIPSFISCHGEPVPRTGPYAQYKVMESARGHVTVLLDGQGGDELLAGYHYFFGNYLIELLHYGKMLTFFKEMFYYYLKHHSHLATKSLLFYLLPNSMKSRVKLGFKNYLKRDFFYQEKGRTKLPKILFDARTLRQSLLQHFEHKLEHLLKWEDRNSMWFSLESRVPFLDHRLVESTLSLPSERIIAEGMTKVILREAMKNIIPEQIRLRKDKMGFETPESEWFRAPIFRKFILNLLNSSSFCRRPYINQRMCRRLYDLHLQRRIDIPREIWKWVNLELWLRTLES